MKKLSLIPLVFVAASLVACSDTSTDESQGANVVDAWAAAVSSQTAEADNPAASEANDATGDQPAPTAPNNAAAPQGSAAPTPTQPVASNMAGQEGAQQQPQGGSTKEQLDAILMNNFTIGETVTINGASATICLRGNGYGTGLLAAGPNTSCEFAKAVMSEQIKDRDATNTDIRNSLRSPVNVTSPVTNEAYSMNCSTDANKLITCTGGNDASVFMY